METRKFTILLAEDEAASRFLYTEELEEAGYRVLVAENGLQVLGTLEDVHHEHQAQDVQDPIETKIHPPRKQRMQSSSQAGESSSTQPLTCRVRGNPGTHGDGSTEGQRLGATLKASRRRSREGKEPG